jgi:L-cysteine desulfidase
MRRLKMVTVFYSLENVVFMLQVNLRDLGFDVSVPGGNQVGLVRAAPFDEKHELANTDLCLVISSESYC